jgi:hypothetical protein
MKKNEELNLERYNYMEKMTPDGWQWEFIRRNKVYKKIYSEIKKKMSKYSGGNPLTNPGDSFFYKKWWEIEKKFGISAFYENEPYGVGIPDPDLPYNLLPNEKKPLFKTSHEPIRVIAPEYLERETRKVWDGPLMEELFRSDKRFACMIYLKNLLSPNNLENTLYVGISPTAKREEVRKDIEAILKKFIPAKINKGIKKPRISEWKFYLQVWDKRHVEGKSLLEIAREFCNLKQGEQRSPNYNKRLRSNYEKVRRAYKEAKKLINQKN